MARPHEHRSLVRLFAGAIRDLTLPLTTGPGTIAVTISLGHASHDREDSMIFLFAALLGITVMA